jgi:hypothetical protein
MIGANIFDAQENEFDFVVSLMKKGILTSNPVMDHICTGTLITRKDIVTAEHCIRGRDISRTEIMLGSVDLKKCFTYYILWWITYEEWAEIEKIHLEFILNDIAVIRVIESL